MKLINPTDAELNHWFADVVCQWRKEFKPSPPDRVIYGWVDKYGKDVPPTPWFTDSADAVLPWLEKSDSWNMQFDQGEMEETVVNVWSPNHGNFTGQSILPRAIVIALLRAHGVEVST